MAAASRATSSSLTWSAGLGEPVAELARDRALGRTVLVGADPVDDSLDGLELFSGCVQTWGAGTRRACAGSTVPEGVESRRPLGQSAASLARVGAYGVTRSRRRASAGVRLALRWLHDAQAATVLDHVEPPPRLRGTTWSIVVACRPQ